MGFVDMQCPKCGAKIREKCNAWAYGSPIKSCPKCGSEFIDKRFREVAVEGFDTRSTDPVLYLKGFGLFLAFTTVCAVLLVFMINFMGGYPTKLVGCLVLCAFAGLVCLVLFICTKLGLGEKDNAKHLEESEKRLQNKEYVKKLEEYGYDIPDKYK